MKVKNFNFQSYKLSKRLKYQNFEVIGYIASVEKMDWYQL